MCLSLHIEVERKHTPFGMRVSDLRLISDALIQPLARRPPPGPGVVGGDQTLRIA
jgi:hypothetical protein